MSGQRRAVLAFGLILDLAAKLDQAGVRPENAPGLDEAVAMVWDLAGALAKMEKTARDCGETALTARAALLNAVVAGRGDFGDWERELTAAGESEVA